MRNAPPLISSLEIWLEEQGILEDEEIVEEMPLKREQQKGRPGLECGMAH